MAQNLLDNRFETQWPQLRATLRDKWRNLTEEDVNQINGNYDILLSKLQQRYGYSREQAEENVQNWISERAPRFAGQERPVVRPVRHEEPIDRRSDSSSFWKWLLALGIPLLLLATYFNTTDRDRMRDTTTTSTTPIANDRIITDNVRAALLANGVIARDLDNVRITTANNVVTLSGTVPSNEQRERIFTTAKNAAGSAQVDNQLIVR